MPRGIVTGRRRLLVVAAVLLCLPVALMSATRAPAVDRGATPLRAAFASFPDYLDPQLSYTAEGWTAMSDVYLPLLTFRHAAGKAGTELVPGLAKSLPKVTDGGRTYTLFLRRGLKYSDGTPIKASDFEYAIERLLRLNSGGYPFYTVIVGTSRYQRTHRGGISGIVTAERSGKIVIHLLRRTSSFSTLLALLFAAPVPRTTPMRDQTFDPPPASGPYTITQSSPGIGWAYARNPVWASNNGPLVSQVPAGHVDQIEVDVMPDPKAEVRGVLSGKIDWMQNPVPPLSIQNLAGHVRSVQLRVNKVPSTYYFWLNMTKPPFDDVRVRRAVNYAVDAKALQRIYFGQTVPTHQILPPGVPGYRRFNLYPYNMAKARQTIAAADPRDRTVTVWTDTESPNTEAGEYFAGQLQKIGFHVRLKVPSADNYFTVIGNRSTPNLDAGWGNWFQDYPHPDDFFRPLLLGSSILPFNNGNFAQIDVPSLNKTINKLNSLSLTPGTEDRYAALDRDYMKLAPWAPYGTRTLTTFVSSRVDLDRVIFSPVFFQYLTSFQLR
jgi:peptide/nickel transport system substrate-binding protein